ncbi:MAG: hypothetical protein PWQ87_190 [Candidatus Woesearchaeota archaeon]|nr:hypothetical protein [Candidatus Woesearchaeota archaeon]
MKKKQEKMGEQDLVKRYHQLPEFLRRFIKNNEAWILKIYFFLFTIIGKILNPFRLLKNRKRKNRKLEIGPGFGRIKGFETIDAVGGLNVDYVYDASKKLPFKDNTFEIVYASHILEHIPWYKTKQVLKEWIRVLKKGGTLEIWVPDGLKIIKQIILEEQGKKTFINNDGWYKFNEERNTYLWANGRIFSYGDGTGRIKSYNWHRTLFTYKFLKSILRDLNLTNIKKMNSKEVRGYDHGWINLGIKGTKNEI